VLRAVTLGAPGAGAVGASALTYDKVSDEPEILLVFAEELACPCPDGVKITTDV
jgi:hypothetical protein